jgi:SPP1 gp7 family putative phage head morphogenesis protein
MNYILKRLAYTEGKAVSALTDYKSYKELGVKKYQFLTMNDGLTCERCDELHERIFPISEFNVGFTANPLHPWCRCRTKPILE